MINRLCICRAWNANCLSSLLVLLLPAAAATAVQQVVFLYLMPVLPTTGEWGMNNLVNSLVSGCGLAACLVFACVPVRLKRRDAERRHLQQKAAAADTGGLSRLVSSKQNPAGFGGVQ